MLKFKLIKKSNNFNKKRIVFSTHYYEKKRNEDRNSTQVCTYYLKKVQSSKFYINDKNIR